MCIHSWEQVSQVWKHQLQGSSSKLLLSPKKTSLDNYMFDIILTYIYNYIYIYIYIIIYIYIYIHIYNIYSCIYIYIYISLTFRTNPENPKSASEALLLVNDGLTSCWFNPQKVGSRIHRQTVRDKEPLIISSTSRKFFPDKQAFPKSLWLFMATCVQSCSWTVLFLPPPPLVPWYLSI